MPENTFNISYGAVAQATPDERAAFIRRTYSHLAGAVFAFVLLEFALFQTTIPQLMMSLLGTTRYSWMIVLGAFMGISWLAENWARSNTSIGMQYAGLSLYVVGEAIIFLPLLYVAASIAGGEVIQSAAVITLLLFIGLTCTVFITRKDFSMLGSFITVSGFIALGIIVASILFGFSLGLLFAAFMVIVAAASILYNTSNVLLRYNTSQHVAAALSLFASVALLFWYILRIMMGFSRRN